MLTEKKDHINKTCVFICVAFTQSHPTLLNWSSLEMFYFKHIFLKLEEFLIMKEIIHGLEYNLWVPYWLPLFVILLFVILFIILQSEGITWNVKCTWFYVIYSLGEKGWMSKGSMCLLDVPVSLRKWTEENNDLEILPLINTPMLLNSLAALCT